MADSASQNYANHRKFVPLYHFVLFPIVLVNFLWNGWEFFRGLGNGFSLDALMSFLTAFAMVSLTLFARTFALQAQNRVIRLEERLRFQAVLPEDLKGRIGEISDNQFIGLRFASDGELPDLVRQVLEGKLRGSEQIKKAIKNWRADLYRL